MIIVEPEMSDEEIVSLINSEIGKRRAYGRRSEAPVSKKPWRRLVWSNSSSSWYQWHDAMRGPQTLDANEIGVEGAGRVKLETLLAELDPLPLYRGSFEARGRGEFSLQGIEIPPPIKKVRDSDLPTDIQTEIALEEKAREN